MYDVVETRVLCFFKTSPCLKSSAVRTKAKIALNPCDISTHMYSKLEGVLQSIGFNSIHHN